MIRESARLYSKPIGNGLYDYYAIFNDGMIMTAWDMDSLDSALESDKNWQATTRSIQGVKSNAEFLGFWDAPCIPRF